MGRMGKINTKSDNPGWGSDCNTVLQHALSLRHQASSFEALIERFILTFLLMSSPQIPPAPSNVLTIGIVKIVRESSELIGKFIDDQVFLAVEVFCWLSNTVESLPEATIEQI